MTYFYILSIIVVKLFRLSQSLFFKLIIISLVIYIAVFIVKCFKMFSEKSYEKGGSMEYWYDGVFIWVGTSWTDELFCRLRDLGFVKLIQCLNIISPSGNKGKYEKHIFKEICSKGINNKVIVSDLEVITDHECNEVCNNNEFVYIEGCNNAINIKNTLGLVDIKKVDIIWDFRGCLWYIKRKGIEKTVEVFEKYYEVLNNNGMIIIDGYDLTFFKFIKYWVMKNFFAIQKGYGENSTYKRLSKLLNKNGGNNNLNKYINANFITVVVPVRNEKGIQIPVAIFKKK